MGTIKIKKVETDTIETDVPIVDMLDVNITLPTNFVIDGSFEQDRWEYENSFKKKKRKVYDHVKIINKNRRKKRDRRIDKYNDSSSNAYGNLVSYHGGLHTGFLAYSYNYRLNRSYIKMKLKHDKKYQIKKGQTYCLSFMVSLAENSKYQLDSLGAIMITSRYLKPKKWKRFLKKKASDIILDNEEKIQQVSFSIDTSNQSNGWILVKGVFIATGQERGLILGNFKENISPMEVQPLNSKESLLPVAYYFLDDIKLMRYEEGCLCDETN